MATSRSATPVRGLWPLLMVADIERSLAFYRDRLGFVVVGRAEPGGRLTWCRLERGAVSLMLQQAEAEDGPPSRWGRGVCLYVVCDDADALHAELSGRGLHLAPPTVAPYGMKQLLVPEPDGYHLCFESPTEDWAG